MNTGAVITMAIGWITSIVPTPVPDAAAALEAEEHRTRRADDGRRGDEHLGEGVAAGEDAGKEDGQRALGEIAGHHDRGPLPPEGSQCVGPAGPSGSDGPRIDAAAGPCHQDPERDGPRDIGEDHEQDAEQGRVQGFPSGGVPDSRSGPLDARLGPSLAPPGTAPGGRPSGPVRRPAGTPHVCAFRDAPRTIVAMTFLPGRHRPRRTAAAGSGHFAAEPETR